MDCRNLDNRENLIVSLHPHNDRGTGMPQPSWADGGRRPCRGELFGNGERTGNVDVVTLALNMFTQGRRSQARLLGHRADQGSLRIFQPDVHSGTPPLCRRTGLHGFLRLASGCHQQGHEGDQTGEQADLGVPYLPIDPRDVGRSYEAIIRINSQSGKGGIAYILQEDYGINLPRNLQIEFREKSSASPTRKARAALEAHP